jgi:hypothetical protein
MVTPVCVSVPKSGPLHLNVELVQVNVRTPVDEFHVYVPLAVFAVPVLELFVVLSDFVQLFVSKITTPIARIRVNQILFFVFIIFLF